MTPVEIATRVEALDHFLVTAMVTNRLTIQSHDEETSHQFSLLYAQLIKGTEEFLGITHEKDTPDAPLG